MPVPDSSARPEAGHARRAPWKCNHSNVPFINREPPPPAEIRFHCECGENWGCPVCGWGAGSYPCKCMREAMQRG